MKRAFTFLQSRFLLAILAGIVWACAFPNIGIAGFAWIAPGLLLFAARGQSGAKAFRIGYIGGLTFWLVSLDWLLRIPYRWHGMPLGPAFGWLVLSAFLALYSGIWCWLCQKIAHGSATTASSETEKSPLAKNEDSSTWSSRSLFALKCAALWVALEMIRTRFLSGFPWIPLGASQHKLTPLIQIASITGVYGVSFLLVWFSVSLLNCVSRLVQHPDKRRSWAGEIIVPFVVIGVVWWWGFQRVMQPTQPGKQTIKLALIQPSIPQEVIWNPNENGSRFEKLMKLSEAALAEKPDALVWPEASMPGFTKENLQALKNLISAHQVWFILGADDAEEQGEETKYFNASFLLDPDGQLAGRYHKQLLVMFGEYVPLAKWLPFLKWFTPVGDFTPGDGPMQFHLNPPGAQTSVLICFEDVFPHHARKHVEDNTDFLLNLTNDGWFGEGAAQWQQAITGLFRAVENGVPLVRCTNTGLTCWIDEFGRMRQFFAESGNIYKEGFLMAEVPIHTGGEKRMQTFYRQHGDRFGWVCTGWAVAFIMLARFRRANGRSK